MGCIAARGLEVGFCPTSPHPAPTESNGTGATAARPPNRALGTARFRQRRSFGPIVATARRRCHRLGRSQAERIRCPSPPQSKRRCTADTRGRALPPRSVLARRRPPRPSTQETIPACSWCGEPRLIPPGSIAVLKGNAGSPQSVVGDRLSAARISETRVSSREPACLPRGRNTRSNTVSQWSRRHARLAEDATARQTPA